MYSLTGWESSNIYKHFIVSPVFGNQRMELCHIVMKLSSDDVNIMSKFTKDLHLGEKRLCG